MVSLQYLHIMIGGYEPLRVWELVSNYREVGAKIMRASFCSHLRYHGWVLRGRTRLVYGIIKDNIVLGVLPFTIGADTVVQMGTGASAAIPDITDNRAALDLLSDLKTVSVIF